MNTMIAYCAGLFDGEGTISIRRWEDKRKKFRLKSVRHALIIEVNQTRPEAIFRLHETFGGRVLFVPRNGKYSGRWFWTIDSQRAANILKQMLPFLTIKRQEAELAIRFQQTKLNQNSGRSFKLGLTSDEVEVRESICNQMRALKRIHNNPETEAEYHKLSALFKPCSPEPLAATQSNCLW